MGEFARRMRPMLGTYVEVGIHVAPTSSLKSFETAFKAIEKVEQLMSFHSSDSELTRLNQSVGTFIELHPWTMKVLRLANAANKASGGLFNPYVGNELIRTGHLPHDQFTQSSNNMQGQIYFGSSDDLEIFGRQARLLRPVTIVLDGIAKGFAVDCAVRALKQSGISAGWVNAGGDLRAFGDVEVPVSRRELNSDIRQIGKLKNAAIATSRMSQSPNSEFPGRIVHHEGAIPGEFLCSVVSTSCWRADVLTKVAFLAESQSRKSIVERLGGKIVSQEEKSA